MRKPVAMGRPRKVGEVLSEERKIKFAPTMYEALEERAAETGLSVSEQVRRAVAVALDPPPPPDLAMVGTQVVKARYLDKAACGNWSEAIARDANFVISLHMAEWMDIQDGDVIVEAMGDSMEEAGIFDESLIVMRPIVGYRKPRNGAICLVQRIDADGTCESLIKYWHNTDPPTLKNGAGKLIVIPDTTERLVPVAEAKGIMTRL